MALPALGTHCGQLLQFFQALVVLYLHLLHQIKVEPLPLQNSVQVQALFEQQLVVFL